MPSEMDVDDSNRKSYFATHRKTAPSVSHSAIPASKTEVLKNLRHIVQPHVESFNFFSERGLRLR